jgi:hypothetical protein
MRKHKRAPATSTRPRHDIGAESVARAATVSRCICATSASMSSKAISLRRRASGSRARAVH